MALAGEVNHCKQAMWVKPVASEVKINMDGNYCGDPPQVGFGGVLRDEDGGWVEGFYGNLGATSVLFVELQGIKHGLRLA